MAERDKNGKFIKGHKPTKPKGVKHKKTVELDELRRKLLNAMDKSQEELEMAFNTALKDKPIEALKLIQNMFPKDYKVSTEDSEFRIVVETIKKKGD